MKLAIAKLPEFWRGITRNRDIEPSAREWMEGYDAALAYCAEQLDQALSHAAGQDGEQCRAASGFLRIVEEMESACCSYAGPDVDYTVEASTVYRWAEALRALSRGVPEGKCWCLTCRPLTFDDMRMALCPDCGNKRCPHANDHRNACTNSNEPGQPGSAYPAIAAQRKEGE